MAYMSRKMASCRAQIVGLFALCFCIMLGISLCQASATADAIRDYKEMKSYFLNDQHQFSNGRPETLIIPSSKLIHSSLLGNVPSSRPVNEEIVLNGNHSKEQVQDIDAINTVKQRTILYDDIQRRDGVHQGNSMDIQVVGPGESNQDGSIKDDDFGRAIEGKVDAAMMSDMHHGFDNRTAPTRIRGNNLNIDVSGISVRAINTVEGGTAIATSNIKIEPVQIIVDSCEASEKLK
jgi:hypothetical protein